MANTLKKIISGGQTGADLGGLRAGFRLGLETGGYMPKGFRTEAGPRPEFKYMYGMIEHPSTSYMPRTELNVLHSDGTLLFGLGASSGSFLTTRVCNLHAKPIFHMFWKQREVLSDVDREFFRSWLHTHKISVLNVAGNREKKNPGIEDACTEFLMKALHDE